MKNHFSAVFLALLLSVLASPWAAPSNAEEKLPEVRNEKMKEEGKVIRITYDLVADGPRFIALMASSDGGKNWDAAPGSVIGDVGPRIWPGTKKEIRWRYEKPKDSPGLAVEVAFGPADPLPAVPAGVKKYFVIPIHGVFGGEVSAEDVETGLSAAADAGADYVVFDVDSPGGAVSELTAIEDAIKRWKKEHKEIRLVSFVTVNAFSAAALFSFLCEDIWMVEGSSIGAALAINIGERSATAVDEKFASALRGRQRNYADFGGHDPLLLEAMMDASYDITCGGKGGKRIARLGTPKEQAADAFDSSTRLVLNKGRLLTMTVKEATDCGLANGTADNYAMLGEKLGAKGWMEVDDSGKQLALNRLRKLEEVKARITYLVDAINEERKDLSKIQVKDSESLMGFERNLLQIREMLDEIYGIVEQNPSASFHVNRVLPRSEMEKLGNYVNEVLTKIRNFRAKKK